MDKKLIVLTVISTLIMASVVYAVSDTKTKTLLYFNIYASRSVQVYIYGGSWETATATGAPTSDNIMFNTSSANLKWANATRVGGDEQDPTNPIIQIQNIGTANAQIDFSINATLPTDPCEILIGYENETMGSPPSPTSFGTANETLTTALTNSDPALKLWLYANYTKCGTGDSTTRNFTIYAEFAA